MKNWFITQFEGNGSSCSWSIRRHARWLIASLAAGCLLCSSAAISNAAPTASLIYTATGPIHGGVAAGSDGVLYFAALSSGTTNSKVIALNPNHTAQWVHTPTSAGAAGDSQPVASFDAVAQHAFVASHAGCTS